MDRLENSRVSEGRFSLSARGEGLGEGLFELVASLGSERNGVDRCGEMGVSGVNAPGKRMPSDSVSNGGSDMAGVTVTAMTGDGGIDAEKPLNMSFSGTAGRESGGSSKGVEGPRDSADDRAP